MAKQGKCTPRNSYDHQNPGPIVVPTGYKEFDTLLVSTKYDRFLEPSSSVFLQIQRTNYIRQAAA
jgi:hypothetical protein